MIVPTPKDVFENPTQFLDFLQSKDFEGQHFDRKEIPSGKQLNSLKECISAFANSNKEGGILVLGISNDGKIKGIKHVDELALNGILQVVNSLKNHATYPKYVSCKNDAGEDDKIILLYVSYTPNAICETNEAFPKAYKRVGPQCLQLTEQDREQLKRDKKIVSFELSYCCPYDVNDLDKGLVEEFKKYFLESHGALYDYTTEEILFQAGAIIKDGDKYAFTNAGYLFFAANPRRILSGAFIRLLRFDTVEINWRNRGLPTFDRDFDGPLPNLIRKIRTFLKDSAFFKTYSKRNPDGGFTDEPELPFIAIDEAIVNALVHREYALNTPIECSSYKDAFLVKSPGNIPQQVPKEFSLDKTSLYPVPRNPKIVEWMRLMKDERGASFVRALSEGTKTMRVEMEKIGLPAPYYKTEENTVVILYNKAVEREAKFSSASIVESQEFTNLFSIQIQNIGDQTISKEGLYELKKNLLVALRDALIGHSWVIDRFSFSRIIAYKANNSLPLPQEVEAILKIYAAYIFQIKQFGSELYLCIDYKAEVKNILPTNELLPYITADKLVGKIAVAKYGDNWEKGKILDVNFESTKIFLFDLNLTLDSPNNAVIPEVSKLEMNMLIKRFNIKYFNLNQKIKEYALASQQNASKTRAEKTIKVARQLLEEVFPLKVSNIVFTISSVPTYLKKPSSGSSIQNVPPLTVYHDINEPSVEFYGGHSEPNILEGLSKFGAYKKYPKNIEIIPICTPERRNQMQHLIERLQQGKFKYRGSERSFGVKLLYRTIITAPRIEDFEDECKRLLKQNPDWCGDKNLSRLFLVYVPEQEFPTTDINSPYYSIKELLFGNGIPVQMVDTPTLDNPDWKDFNLALNIIAKCGITPWVLPDELPDADFFIGLSYTQQRGRKIDRLMGFANVFNSYGRWQFYKGSAQAFNYDDRLKYYKELVKTTLEHLDLSETPSIHFHYSAKFSKEDVLVILEAAKSVRPKGKYTFVWINTGHNVRLYDSSVQSDGSLSRGAYVFTSPNQFYLSTTGYNVYKKTLGTPEMLEVNVRIEPFIRSNPIDLKTIAMQLLYLTKLNWASTQSLCWEPITTKYAGDIARLTSIFLERSGEFELHPVLEGTTWFI